jgi:hypothetical protein
MVADPGDDNALMARVMLNDRQRLGIVGLARLM